MKKNRTLEAEYLNNLTFHDYLDRLSVIALSHFKWDGLPNSCNERYLEKCLFTHGKCAFVFDESLGYLTLKCSNREFLNVYEEPVSYNVFSTNYNKDFKADDIVVIRNNIIEKPTLESLMMFCQRLTEVERTTDVNIKTSKTPALIVTDDKDRLTMLNLLEQYEGNVPFVVGGKALNVDGIKTLTLNIPYLADKLSVYKQRIWSEALTFLGINNSDVEKKERLITDEVNANNELIDNMNVSQLEMRQQACKEINEKFGLNVSVKVSTDGGEEDGEVHDRTENTSREQDTDI